jgi:hypothetical protein
MYTSLILDHMYSSKIKLLESSQTRQDTIGGVEILISHMAVAFEACLPVRALTACTSGTCIYLTSSGLIIKTNPPQCEYLGECLG